MDLDNATNLQMLFATAPAGVAMADAATLRIEMVNDAFLKITGKPVWDAFAEAATVYAPGMEKVIRSGKPFRGEDAEIMLIRHGKEESLFISFVYMPLFDEKKAVNKVAVWVMGNTDKVQAHQKIQRLNAELSLTGEQLLATQLAVDAAYIGI